MMDIEHTVVMYMQWYVFCNFNIVVCVYCIQKCGMCICTDVSTILESYLRWRRREKLGFSRGGNNMAHSFASAGFEHLAIDALTNCSASMYAEVQYMSLMEVVCRRGMLNLIKCMFSLGYDTRFDSSEDLLKHLPSEHSFDQTDGRLCTEMIQLLEAGGYKLNVKCTGVDTLKHLAVDKVRKCMVANGGNVFVKVQTLIEETTDECGDPIVTNDCFDQLRGDLDVMEYQQYE